MKLPYHLEIMDNDSFRQVLQSTPSSFGSESLWDSTVKAKTAPVNQPNLYWQADRWGVDPKTLEILVAYNSNDTIQRIYMYSAVASLKKTGEGMYLCKDFKRKLNEIPWLILLDSSQIRQIHKARDFGLSRLGTGTFMLDRVTYTMLNLAALSYHEHIVWPSLSSCSKIPTTSTSPPAPVSILTEQKYPVILAPSAPNNPYNLAPSYAPTSTTSSPVISTTIPIKKTKIPKTTGPIYQKAATRYAGELASKSQWITSGTIDQLIQLRQETMAFADFIDASRQSLTEKQYKVWKGVSDI